MNQSIALNNITISYQKHPAVHHLSAFFPLQQISAIIGPNGAGKSTLLKAIMQFVAPEEGEIIVPIAMSSTAYLPQQSEIDRSLPLTVYELLASGLMHMLGAFKGIRRCDQEKIENALAAVGLSDFGHRSIGSLSNGQFQRALFARILLQDSQLILLDEPFNAIDSKTIGDLCAIIQQWQQQGRTVIAVVHDLSLVSQYFTHTVIIARELVACGKTNEVLTPANIQRAYQTLLHWSDAAPWCEGMPDTSDEP